MANVLKQRYLMNKYLRFKNNLVKILTSATTVEAEDRGRGLSQNTVVLSVLFLKPVCINVWLLERQIDMV
jgi:hypothetical protein